jgi:hypothetical protein
MPSCEKGHELMPTITSLPLPQASAAPSPRQKAIAAVVQEIRAAGGTAADVRPLASVRPFYGEVADAMEAPPS